MHRRVTQVALFSFLCLPCIVIAADKPNIVIILTDDQGYADVSYNPHSPPEV
ncbi:MAG: N-acetylgalactosamine 6-sulfatase (GALNS), partial [Planctomycetaceae bacterium]|nr:N-acetylgalactosamine 6-sulfatase (GALNS) [Planctomycetaceae bacterium]